MAKGDYPTLFPFIHAKVSILLHTVFSEWVYYLHLQGMRNTIRDDLRRKIIVGYTAVLKRARRRIKGIRLGHLWVIDILGCNPDGCRLTDLAKAGGIQANSVLIKIKGAMYYGYIAKEGRLYKLTDKGREAFRILDEEFAPELEAIIKGLMEEVRRRI